MTGWRRTDEEVDYDGFENDEEYELREIDDDDWDPEINDPWKNYWKGRKGTHLTTTMSIRRETIHQGTITTCHLNSQPVTSSHIREPYKPLALALCLPPIELQNTWFSKYEKRAVLSARLIR